MTIVDDVLKMITKAEDMQTDFPFSFDFDFLYSSTLKENIMYDYMDITIRCKKCERLMTYPIRAQDIKYRELITKFTINFYENHILQGFCRYKIIKKSL